jgi:hypothetical protein
VPCRLPTIVALALAAASWTLPGCGSGCKPYAEVALEVTVLDGPGGAALCGATVTVRDGAFSQVLAASSVPPCMYTGPSERPGVYDIEATFEGRTATLLDVGVGANGCHVDRTDVEIVLPKAAP